MIRKRFGQNFLSDPGITDKIIRDLNPKPDERILEIGPGRGALTRPLSLSGCDLKLVEIDRDLAALMQREFPDVELVCADVLKVDLAGLFTATPIRVVGNLPYNISTPLMFKLLACDGLVSDMHLMLQLEVAERITADVGTSAYGRLTVMTQAYCYPQIRFEVSPEAFSPRPKVRSALVRLTPHQDHADMDRAHLKKVLTHAFNARRKTLRNALKLLLKAEELESIGIDPGLRPEQLTIGDFAACAVLIGGKRQ